MKRILTLGSLLRAFAFAAPFPPTLAADRVGRPQSLPPGGNQTHFLRLAGPEGLVVRVTGPGAAVQGSELLLRQVLADANRPCLAAATWAETARCVLRNWQAQLGEPAIAVADVTLVTGPGTRHEERHTEASGLQVDARLLRQLVDATLADGTHMAEPYVGAHVAQYTHVQVEVQLHGWTHGLLHTLGLASHANPRLRPQAPAARMPPVATGRGNTTVQVSTTLVAAAWQGADDTSTGQRVVEWLWVLSVLYLLAYGAHTAQARPDQQPPHQATDRKAAPKAMNTVTSC